MAFSSPVIEAWILEGRVDCGFLRLPTHPDLETIFLEQDKLLAILPENHPLAAWEQVPVQALCEYPFMRLEKGANAEVSQIFERCGLAPNVHFTTWDDYAIMSMGFSIPTAQEALHPVFILCIRQVDI